MKKFFILFVGALCCMALSMQSMGQTRTEATITFSELGFENAEDIDGVTMNMDDNVTVTFNKAGGNNGPKYYNTGTAIRAYVGNTITLTAGTSIITDIVFTPGSGDNYNNDVSSDAGTTDYPIWTGSAGVVTFVIGGDSGHRRVAAITVTYQTDPFTFSFNESNHTAIVTGHVDGNQAIGELDIPETVLYNGERYLVTEIGYACFATAGGVTSISIPQSITKIAALAFDGTGIESIVIPESVTSLGNQIFYGCQNLSSVTLPSGITNIGYGLFQYCRALPAITLPSSLESIGTKAFLNCLSLRSVTLLSETPPTLDASAFNEVDKSLVTLYVPCGSLDAYQDAEGWNEFSTFIEQCPCNIVATSNPSDGGTITGAGNYEQGATCTLTATAYEGYTFVNWTEDGEVVSTDAAYSFTVTGSRNLVANFYENAAYPFTFSFNESNHTAIVTGHVDGNQAIGELDIPETVLYSGESYSVTEIGYAAFAGAGGVTSISIPQSITKIAALAFDGTGIESIVIPESVTSLGNQIFYGCQSLSSVTLPSGITNIGYGLFQYCRALPTLTLPSSLESIGAVAFLNCLSLRSVTLLSETPPTLDASAFDEVDKSLVALYVPCGSLDAYQDAEGWNEFSTFIEQCPCNIVATSNPSDGGTITGAGNYEQGATCTLTATAYEGYTFVNWTEDGEVVSTDATYSFAVTGSRNLVANFTEQSTITNHWIPESAGFEDNMTLTCVVQIDGVEQTSEMLELGAFCGDQCRGSQRPAYFAPTQRYIYQMTVFGETGEEITFRLYNHELQQELDLASPSPVNVAANGYGTLSDPFVLNFCSSVNHVQPLAGGWNWWSTYVELSGIDGLGQMENSLGSSGLLIKSRNNGYVEVFDNNGIVSWYGPLSSICNEQMYKVRTAADCEVVITGIPALAENHPITINPGWNWIGFPSSESVSVETAMAGFTPEENDVIKGRNSYTTYYNQNGYQMWYGTLNTLEPGKGYMYRSYSSTQKTLTFQSGRGEVLVENVTDENNVFRVDGGDFADNMTITAVVEVEGMELRSDTYELAAFVGETCRGSVKLMYVEPIDRYVAFLTVLGETPETLQFQLTDGTGTSVSLDEMAFVGDGMVGSLTDPATLRFGTLGVEDQESSQVSVFPNPSEGVFRITAEGLQRVEVFNALGQLVLTEEVSGSDLELDLNAHANGLYLLRVVTGNRVYCQQIVKK